MNNQLIKTNENIFTKIRNFFKKNLYKIKDNSKDNVKTIEKEDIKEKEKDKNIDKSEFMDLYNKMKNGEVLLALLDEETLSNMCKLIKEEIKLTQNQINNLKNNT